MSSIDPITLEVIRSGLISLCREMGVAQAEFNPVHLGSMPYAVEWSLKEIGIENLEPGDVIFHNDPFRGGTHITDYTVIMPVFWKGELIVIPATLAHQIDVGGKVPGGFAGDATEIFQEGVRLPPVKAWSRGRVVKDVWKIILSNVRVPKMIQGDFRAMFASLKVAERRILDYVSKYGVETFKTACEEIKNYSERRMRAEIENLPDGSYEFEDYLEDDGVTLEKYKVKVKITIKGSNLIADFTGSSKQAKGPINATYGVTASQTYSAVLQVTDPFIPSNHGCFRPIKIIAPAGTIVNADYPAPVFGGNVETSTCIVDVILGALFKAVPERVAAACYGTCHNFTCGGIHHETGEPYVFYLYQEGGWGGRYKSDGNLAIISPIGNYHNQPVEIFESRFPWIYERYSLTDDSGGPGKQRGGLGTHQIIRLLAPEARLSLIGERYKIPPFGLFGGLPPVPRECGHYNDFRFRLKGQNEFKHATELFNKLSPSKWADITLHEGDAVEYLTTGGGGYGDPLERDPELVAWDVLNGYVSRENARKYYGVVLKDDCSVDKEATEKLRAEMRAAKGRGG